MNGKIISNILLNIPGESREWLMQNVAPETLARWARQSSVALRPYRNLKEKVKAITSGEEELSDLAKWEKLNYDTRTIH